MDDFLKSALASLPAVAASPRAFVAYCLLLVVWLVIVIKVKRHRQLLSHLHKLPPKDRLKALQDELGGVKIKSGLTPEQWIRSQTRRYLFLGFIAFLVAVTILFTVAVTNRPEVGSAATDITLVPEKLVTFLPEKLETPSSQALSSKPRSSANDLQLTYVYDRSGDIIRVRPRMPYLDLMARGGPVSGLNEDVQWNFPKFAVSIVNNTNRSLLLTEVRVTVHASTVNSDPILIFADESQDSLVITNLGWGEVRDPRIDFGFTAEENCPTLIPAKMRLSHSITLKSFSERTTVPIKVPEPEITQDKEGRQVLSIFSLIEPCVYGRIRYSTDGGARKSLWFKTRVYLGPPRYGAVLTASSVNALFLEAGKQGYVKRLTISQFLRPGEADRFVIVVGTDKSAHFNLNMDFLSAEGIALKGKLLDLETFVPSFQGSHRKTVVDIATSHMELKHSPSPKPVIQDPLSRLQEQLEKSEQTLRALEEIERSRRAVEEFERTRQLAPFPSLSPPVDAQDSPPPA